MQNVRPAVVVEVEKSAAPAQILGVRAQAAGERGIFEIAVAQVVIKRRSVAGKIGFDDVEVAVQIIVGRRNAHACLRLAVGAEYATGFHGNVYEFAILLVLVKRAGGGIVGDVDVGPAVVVEIGRQHAQPEGAVGLQIPDAFGTSVKVPSPLLW